ncbi:glycoside hydrolase [Hypoxylon sp. FL1150]|nr:glycoside hydrolase [Hypoxylon sp. FL1150]
MLQEDSCCSTVATSCARSLTPIRVSCCALIKAIPMKNSHRNKTAKTMSSKQRAMELAPRANLASWGGLNNYFLIGISDSAQNDYINSLASFGLKVVRLWVNGQSAGSSLCNYDDTVLDAIDSVLVKLAAKGIKAIISPHDAANQFKSGSSDPHVLKYKGKSSNHVWKNWNAAIMAFDLQNEPMLTKTEEHTGTAGTNWIASGSLGGDISQGCTFMPAAVNCAQLDMIAIHRYAGTEAANPNEWSASAPGDVSQANGKLVYVEEWGANDMNKVGLSFLYRQIVLPKTCSYDPTTDSDDSFSIFTDSEVDSGGPMKKASSTTGLQDWTGIVY